MIFLVAAERCGRRPREDPLAVFLLEQGRKAWTCRG
jgi:hypothetical protein